MVIPEEAGTGHAPQSLAKAASERIRSGLSPKIINIAAAVLAPTAKPSRRVGDVSAVSRARCRSCVVLSSARVSQRRASDRSVCFPDATGVSSGPGRNPAQRVTSARSVRALQGLSQHRWRIDEDLFERAHRGGAGFDHAISCDFELPPVPPTAAATGGCAWPSVDDPAAATARSAHATDPDDGVATPLGAPAPPPLITSGSSWLESCKTTVSRRFLLVPGSRTDVGRIRAGTGRSGPGRSHAGTP